MLTESFIASTLNVDKPNNKTVVGIHVHDFQPLPALKSTFKKSSTHANCLAVSPTHIFAAQADKAVVHVYSRERNNQEAVVPFPEKVHSVALAGESDGAGTLILGTEGGRVILWELGTGRQVSTPQHHLQATVCLAVDPISNFLLSGSTDSNIHVWSIPRLLSFSVASDSNDGQNVLFAPLRSLSNHRAAITAVIFGHSFSNHNIAVSASRDKTCIVWDYANGDALHTFLLASSPLCLALDPADRAVYAGYEDGSVQLMDFYTSGGVVQATHNPTLHSTPIQPPPDTRWLSDPSASAICLQVSYDGTTLLSGHQDGKLQTWDVATGKFSKSLVNFYAPLTNIAMLEPAGFPEALRPKLKLHHVVKPRYESLFNPDNAIPTNYNFTAQFTSTLPLTGSRYDTSFQEALNHSSFPPSLLEGALSEFSTVSNTTDTSQNSAEFSNLRAQNLELSSRLDRAVEIQKKAVSEVQEQEKERWRRLQHEEIKSARKKRRRLRRMRADEIGRKRAMGEITDDSNEEMKREDERHQKPELSSSTEEMTETE